QVAGVGVLALPWAIAQTGWSGVFILCFTLVTTVYSAMKLGTCWVIMEERWPEYKTTCRKPYPEMAFRTLGTPGKYVVDVVTVFSLFGVGVITLLLSAELLASVIEDIGQLGWMTVCWWLIICAIIFTPLSWLSSPKNFKFVSIVALTATVAAVVVVIIKVGLEEPSYTPQYPSPNFQSFFIGVGSIMFCFGGAVVFPSIQNDMADRTKFNYSILIAFAVLLLIYLPVGVLGYYEFGNWVNVNILLQIFGPSVTITKALFLFNNTFTFILVINPISLTLEERFGIRNEFSCSRCVLRSTLVMLGVLVALSVQDFGKILNFVGALTVPLMCFILPPIFYLRLCDDVSQPTWTRRIVSKYERVILYTVVIIGVLSCGFSTFTSIHALFSPGAISTSCFVSW
ncbi:unnamed protein product, partial [Meganyctiphanes norvegica]